ncbi:MAG: hypothetical protein Q9222_002645 [Ikaeria aurantiellina]
MFRQSLLISTFLTFLWLVLQSSATSIANAKELAIDVAIPSSGKNVSDVTNPTALNIKVQIPSDGKGGPAPMTSLYSYLNAEPRITSLSLKVSEHGCVVGFDPMAFPFKPNDRFPSLTTIRLQGYGFHDLNGQIREQHSRATSGIRGLRSYLANEYDGYEWLRPKPLQRNIQQEGDNLRLWRKAMDWTLIEHLELRGVDLLTFFEQLTGGLNRLRKLKLWPPRFSQNNEGFFQAADAFLMSLTNLQSLSLHGYTGKANLTAILKKNAATLESVEIREWETSHWDTRPVLSPNQLLELNSICPDLKKLSIDVNRNGTWPLEVFDALSSFEKLQELRLNLELGTNQHAGESSDWLPRGLRNISSGEFRQPLYDAVSGSELFRYLKTKKGVILEKMGLSTIMSDLSAFAQFASSGVFSGQNVISLPDTTTVLDLAFKPYLFTQAMATNGWRAYWDPPDNADGSWSNSTAERIVKNHRAYYPVADSGPSGQLTNAILDHGWGSLEAVFDDGYDCTINEGGRSGQPVLKIADGRLDSSCLSQLKMQTGCDDLSKGWTEGCDSFFEQHKKPTLLRGIDRIRCGCEGC